MATLANLRTYVSSKLGLDNTASSAEQLLMDAWANEAVRQILLRTRIRVQIATMTLTVSSDDYELDTNVLAIDKIVDANDNPLVRVSPEEIYDLRKSASLVSQNTAVGETYRYTLNGANLLMLWPTPQTADVLTVYYVPKPTEMTTGTHDPSATTYGGIPVEYHKAIEYYMLAEGGDYDENRPSGYGQSYRDRFEAEIAKIRRSKNTKAGRKLAPIRMGRRHPVSSDPSRGPVFY